MDKWLKINAMCPLCKAEVVESEAGVNSVQEEANRNLAE